MTGTFGRVEASVVVARVNLVRLSDHEVVKVVLLIHFVERQIRDFLDALEVQVALHHGRLGDEQFENDKEANDRVAIELEAFVVVFSAGAWRGQCFFYDVDFLKQLFPHEDSFDSVRVGNLHQLGVSLKDVFGCFCWL